MSKAKDIELFTLENYQSFIRQLEKEINNIPKDTEDKLSAVQEILDNHDRHIINRMVDLKKEEPRIITP